MITEPFNNRKIFYRKEFFGSILYSTTDKSYFFLEEEEDQAYRYIVENKHTSLPKAYQDFASELRAKRLLFNNIEFLNYSRDKFFSAPLRVFIDITSSCNLRCAHCFTDSGWRAKDELKTEEIYHLIDQMRDSGTFLLSVAGGEPLARRDIFQIFEYCRSKQIDLSFTTNGTLVTERIAKKLDALQLKTITVSIDGIECHHDRIRGEGNFQKAIRGVQILKQYCPSATIAIKNTINQLNKSDYKALIQVAEDLGVHIKFNPIRKFGRADTNNDLLINQQDYIAFLKGVQDVKAQVKVSIPKTPLDKTPYDFIKVGFGCVGGKETCNIASNGNFSSCAFLGKDYVVGNIKQDTFKDLWIKTNHSVDWEGNEICKNCPAYMDCRGGCRSRSLFELGDVNAVDPMCPLLRNEKVVNPSCEKAFCKGQCGC